MADTIGLYYKTGGAETGGTNSLTGLLTGGTRISTGDTEATPFAFAALDTVYTLYYKAEDDATFEDAGKDTLAAFTITAPTGVQVCDTHNGTFASSVSVPAAVGAYKPVFAKQVARQASNEADLEVGTGGVTFVTGTRVAQVGTVTLNTSTAGQLSASWDAVANADGYRVQYKESASGTWLDAADVTSPSVITGLAHGVSHDVRVSAYSELGVGAWSATATATVTPFVFSNSFATEALKTANLTLVTAGTVTAEVTGGELKLTGDALAGDAAGVYLNSVLGTTENRRYTFAFKVQSQNGGGAVFPIGIIQKTSAPEAETGANFTPRRRLTTGINTSVGGLPGTCITQSYWNASNVRKAYHWSGAFAGTWSQNAAGVAEEYLVLSASTTPAFYRVVYEVDYNAGNPRWRLIYKNADGSVTYGTTAYVAFSDFYSTTGDYYLFGGDLVTDSAYGDERYTLISAETY